jgi:Sigma-70 region 2
MHVVSLQASDAELIAASLTEPARFADVFDRHYAAILQYLRRRIDRSSADELAGDTFAVAFRSRDKFDPSRRQCTTVALWDRDEPSSPKQAARSPPAPRPFPRGSRSNPASCVGDR